MLKKYKKTLILTNVLILMPMLVGFLLWDKLPAEMATHFNAQGEADGWSSKSFTVFGLPAILFGFHWLCLLGSNADPKNKNYSEKLLQLVFWICPLISVLFGVISYGTALGMEFKVDKIMLILVGVVFIVIGNYMPKCKQNYTMGIKLPWTLNDEENWNKTHRMAGKLWVITGFLCMLCILVPTIVMVVTFIIILVVSTMIPTIYSYLLYKNKQKSGE